MKWLVVFYMATAGEFSVPTLEFDTYNQCVEYVNDPSKASRLAIEVIEVAGFNDELLAVVCLPENEVREHINETEHKI